MKTIQPSVEQHFEGKSTAVRSTYDRLLRAVGKFGKFEEDPKKTSIHLVHRTAFAGVATRNAALILTLKSGRDIKSKRIHKHEQASAGRWHLEVRIERAAEVDRELIGWLRAAYELSG